MLLSVPVWYSMMAVWWCVRKLIRISPVCQGRLMRYPEPPLNVTASVGDWTPETLIKDCFYCEVGNFTPVLSRRPYHGSQPQLVSLWFISISYFYYDHFRISSRCGRKQNIDLRESLVLVTTEAVLLLQLGLGHLSLRSCLKLPGQYNIHYILI